MLKSYFIMTQTAKNPVSKTTQDDSQKRQLIKLLDNKNFLSKLISTHYKQTALRLLVASGLWTMCKLGAFLEKKKCCWFKGTPPITLIYGKRKRIFNIQYFWATLRNFVIEGVACQLPSTSHSSISNFLTPQWIIANFKKLQFWLGQKSFKFLVGILRETMTS